MTPSRSAPSTPAAACSPAPRKDPRLLQPGSLVGVPAGRVHACNPLPGQVWSYQMLHLDPRWMAEVRAEYDDLPEPDWQQEPIGFPTIARATSSTASSTRRCSPTIRSASRKRP
jgi:hypothetical protein